MKDVIQSNKIAIVFLTIVLSVIIGIFLLRKKSEKQPPIIVISPTPIVSIMLSSVAPSITVTLLPTFPRVSGALDGPQAGVDYYSIDPETEKQYVQLGKLLEIVPYQGTNFSFIYDIDKNNYIATISADNKIVGEQEFDTFLKGNGIENRTWIHNLVIEYK